MKPSYAPPGRDDWERWRSSFHKGRFTTAAAPTNYGKTIPVLGRDDACNWPALPVDDGSES